MRCTACNYEYLVDYDNDSKVVAGDERFIQIGHGMKLSVRQYPLEEYTVSLYGCPKCHTVRFEKVW